MGRTLWALLLVAPAAGCFGITQNPSYFPYYLPTGDIIRTHAKPPGHGYFANFDPHAVRLEVTPLESSGPTRGQCLIVASVTDENGQPRGGSTRLTSSRNLRGFAKSPTELTTRN